MIALLRSLFLKGARFPLMILIFRGEGGACRSRTSCSKEICLSYSLFASDMQSIGFRDPDFL